MEKTNNLQNQNDETYDAHRPALDYHFKSAEMEFNFQWICGSMTTGGCELGEAFYVAKQIEDGEEEGTVEKWQAEWQNMGKRKEAMALDSLLGGHKVSAMEAFLLASNYFRASLISRLPFLKSSPDQMNEDYLEVAAKYKECFREATKLFKTPTAFFNYNIPENGHKTGSDTFPFPAYFIQPEPKDEKRKTLVMIGGGETFMEEMYLYIAPFALRRGYNFLTCDLPGQGTTPVHGHYFREDTEVQIGALLDEAFKRFPAIDHSQVAMFGISNGGYFVPRASCFDDRIKAIAVSNAVTDNYKMFKEMPFEKESKEEINNWADFRWNVTAAVAYRWGTDIKGQTEATKNFQFDPGMIGCPALALVSSGELSGEAERQQYEFMKMLPNNRHHKMIVSDQEVGAISHCLAENRSYMAQVLFDWFDEVFADLVKD